MSQERSGVVRALIADDEPLLVEALSKELSAVWPELEIANVASNGHEALAMLNEDPVDIAFLDIRMPGLSGLDVAQRLAMSWQNSVPGRAGVAAPLIVFVTAYGEFAIDAFESAAVDYLLKPVTRTRLLASTERLSRRLTESRAGSQASEIQTLALLSERIGVLRGVSAPTEYLSVIRAGVGDSVRMIPAAQVILLEAADKYVLVHTANGEALIRESLRELRERLDPAIFQQIHRSAIVNMQHVEVADRDENGKTVLGLRDVALKPVVSRQFAYLFKAM